MNYILLDTLLLDGFYVTQNYMNNPTYYAQFGLKGHEGVDFGHKDKKVKVRSPISGTVFVSWDDAYGNFAVIEDYKQNCGIYICHMDNVQVVSGQEVKAGQIIGEMGATGNANGEHVHLNFIILDTKGNKKYNAKTYNYGYLDPRYPRDTGATVSLPGVEEYSISWVKSVSDTNNTMPGTITLTPEQFESMRTKSDQVDALATYFKIDSKDLRAAQVILNYEEQKNQKEAAQKSEADKDKQLQEALSDLRTVKTTSEDRKKTYDELIEFLANGLMCAGDESVIRGQFKELLTVESKLDTANKTIEQINEEHAKEKETLSLKIDQLNKDLDIKQEQLNDLKDQAKDLKDQLKELQQEKEKIDMFKKIVDDISSFFKKLTGKKDDKENKDVK